MGDGTLPYDVREQLEGEGILFLEEGLSGSIRYSRFRAPGRRFNNRVTAERMGLGISAERIALYCHSGSAKLIDNPFSADAFSYVEVDVEHDGRLVFTIDYDGAGKPEHSGQVRIHVLTPNAAAIADMVRPRLSRA